MYLSDVSFRYTPSLFAGRDVRREGTQEQEVQGALGKPVAAPLASAPRAWSAAAAQAACATAREQARARPGSPDLARRLQRPGQPGSNLIN